MDQQRVRGIGISIAESRMAVAQPEPILLMKESFPGSSQLRAFNEQEGDVKKQLEIQGSTSSPPLSPSTPPQEILPQKGIAVNAEESTKQLENVVVDAGVVVATEKTTPRPPQKIEEELSSKKTKTTQKETGGSNTEKPTPSKNGSKSGIAGRISTAWENVKRMLGFAPDCHNGGYRTIGSQSCTCPQYFEGQFCERILCINGGKRVPVAAFGAEEVCKCPDPDYIRGKHCEQVHCQNGGRLLNDGRCHCVDGWYSGQFCQYYTSSWLLAIGMPLLFITFVIFCCVICRMDLCALRRHPPPRNRHPDRRSHGRRRQQPNHPTSNGAGGGSNNRSNNNRHRREQIPFRQRDEELAGRQQQYPPSQQNPHNLYIQQQNLLNGQQQQNQPQYVLRLEQIPMYNPRLYVPIDKPMEPPPSYEQAVLCPPPNQDPPNYCPQPPNQAIVVDMSGESTPSNRHEREERRNRALSQDGEQRENSTEGAERNNETSARRPPNNE